MKQEGGRGGSDRKERRGEKWEKGKGENGNNGKNWKDSHMSGLPTSYLASPIGIESRVLRKVCPETSSQAPSLATLS